MNKFGAILFLLVVMASVVSAASIAVTYPKEISGHAYCTGQPCGVGWTKEGTLPDTVKITLRNKTSTVELMVIAASAPNTGQFYPWTIPADLADGQYVIRVKAIGAAVHGDSAAFTIKTCPAIKITSPLEGAAWQETTTHVIAWTKAGSLPNEVRIELWDANKNPARTIAANAPNSGSFSWLVPGDIKTGNYYLNVSARLNPTGDSSVIQDTKPFKITLKFYPTPEPIKKWFANIVRTTGIMNLGQTFGAPATDTITRPTGHVS